MHTAANCCNSGEFCSFHRHQRQSTISRRAIYPTKRRSPAGQQRPPRRRRAVMGLSCSTVCARHRGSVTVVFRFCGCVARIIRIAARHFRIYAADLFAPDTQRSQRTVESAWAQRCSIRHAWLIRYNTTVTYYYTYWATLLVMQYVNIIEWATHIRLKSIGCVKCAHVFSGITIKSRFCTL